MFIGHRSVYFDYNPMDENKLPFEKLVNLITEAVEKHNVEYALNKFATVNDLIFYKAVEAYKCQGGKIKNMYIKFEGWPPRKFDGCFKIKRKRNVSIVAHLKRKADILISFYNGELQLIEKN